MKKLLLILSLISLTAQAMEVVDEEAAIPLPAGQEPPAEEIEPEQEGRPREREILFCTRLRRRLFICTEKCTEWAFENPKRGIFTPAIIIAIGGAFCLWYIIDSSI